MPRSEYHEGQEEAARDQEPADYGVDTAPRLTTLKVTEPPVARPAEVEASRLVAKLKDMGAACWKTHSSCAEHGKRAAAPRRSPRSPPRGRWAAVHVLVAGELPRRRRRSRDNRRGRQGLLAKDAAYADQLAENVAPLVAELMADYDAFLAPATTTGKNIAPRVAALLDVMQVSDILSVEGARPSPARSTPATPSPRSRSRTPSWSITVRTTAFDKAEAEAARRGSRKSPARATRVCRVSSPLEAPKSERPELTSAAWSCRAGAR